MARDPRLTAGYAYGQNQAFHEAALHMIRMGQREDADMFRRWAERALKQAKESKSV